MAETAQRRWEHNLNCSVDEYFKFVEDNQGFMASALLSVPSIFVTEIYDDGEIITWYPTWLIIADRKRQ